MDDEKSVSADKTSVPGYSRKGRDSLTNVGGVY